MTIALKGLFRATQWMFLGLTCVALSSKGGEPGASKFNVIAFYTGKDDLAHISFVHEANQWFPKAAAEYHFSYESTTNWDNLNAEFLSHYQVVLFLDTRPEKPAQRLAFQ